MNKMIKIITSILFAAIIIILVSINNEVQAISVNDGYAGNGIGSSVTINVSGANDDYYRDVQLFCTEKNTSFPAGTFEYIVKAQVELIGDKADITYTTESGVATTSSTNDQNKYLGYLISRYPALWDYNSSNSNINTLLSGSTDIYPSKWHHYKSPNDATGGTYGDLALWMWNYLPTWSKKTGNNVLDYMIQDYSLKLIGTDAELGFDTSDNQQTRLKNVMNGANKYLSENSTSTTIVNNTGNVVTRNVVLNTVSYTQIGPFNVTLPESLKEINVLNQNGQVISGVKYCRYNGSQLVELEENMIGSKINFYLLIPNNTGATAITGVNLKTNAVDVHSAKLTFMERKNGESYQNVVYVTSSSAAQELELDIPLDIELSGNLKLVKVRQSDSLETEEIPLSNVGFKIKNNDTNEYVVKSSSGVISYTTNVNSATVFKTDRNGVIDIDGLKTGTYSAIEVTNPNYGYDIVETDTTFEIEAGENTVKVRNVQTEIRLSGYVWEDRVDGKTSIRNDLYDDSTIDRLVEGITVKLKDSTGNVIKQTITNSNGAYTFTEVPLTNLDTHYIEFEYDGLDYANVSSNITVANGSKAIENVNTRNTFDNNFTRIMPNSSNNESEGITLNTQNQNVHTLQYDLDKANGTSSLNDNNYFPIVATTKDANYTITTGFDPVSGSALSTEITNINLGIYLREQPDLALKSDINNVRLEINGQAQTYLYSSRFANAELDGYDVGVKFGEKYGSEAYSRPVYKSDYEFESTNENEELQLYLTYQVGIQNQSTNLYSKVQMISNYIDSRYEIMSVGTTLDSNGKVIQDSGMEFQTSGTTGNYTAGLITSENGINVGPQQQSVIYIEYKISRDSISSIFDENGSVTGNDTFNAIFEIFEYGTYENSNYTNVYAGVDVDSNPGNVDIDDRTTIQDDTDFAPGIKLVLKEERTTSGTVFVDSTSSELQTGEIRQGDGIYTDGEKTLEGVEVILEEVNGKVAQITTTTDSNGNYQLSGYIPGEYVITYNWGDESYTVQSYKATVYDVNRDQSDTLWYQEDVDTRKSDALDNYSTRQTIDEEIVNNEFVTTKMDARTPEMSVKIENIPANTILTGEEYVNEIRNIDFGIVERARQVLSMDKRVDEVKLVSANGQTLVDTQIAEDGTLSGEIGTLTHIPQSDFANPANGFVKIELDPEITQGATLEVSYAFEVANMSEVDYLTQEYYEYGTNRVNEVKLQIEGIVDYLDSDWAFEGDSTWEVTNISEIRDLLTYNPDEVEMFDERTILYSDDIFEITAANNKVLDLNVSKLLSISEDIELDNETEIIKVNQNGGARLTTIPGNYVPGTSSKEMDEDLAERVIITPNTGDNLNYIVPIAITVISLGVLAIGTIIIKKKVLKND